MNRYPDIGDHGLMSWVALDRAVRLARDRIYKEIMQRGCNPEREAFVQNYANDVLDASLLLMPLAGFAAPRPGRQFDPAASSVGFRDASLGPMSHVTTEESTSA